MDTPSARYLKDIPHKPYDLVKELVIIFGVVLLMLIILAAVFKSPDYPTITGADVAKHQPVAYLKTALDILAGNASIQDYGPPYNSDTSNSQHFLGIAPATWGGVTIPIDPEQDFIIKPLQQMAVINPRLSPVLSTWNSASTDQKETWTTNYSVALDSATVINGNVVISNGDYGPVGEMMSAMLTLGQSGLLEGALDQNSQLPYVTNPTNSLLFFQDDVYASAADMLDLTGSQWGIVHETGNYPGAWWLNPYAIFYHIPPMSTSANGDIEVGVIMIVILLILLLLPFIPGLNRLPRWLGVYKIIWRDWYKSAKAK